MRVCVVAITVEVAVKIVVTVVADVYARVLDARTWSAALTSHAVRARSRATAAMEQTFQVLLRCWRVRRERLEFAVVQAGHNVVVH